MSTNLLALGLSLLQTSDASSRWNVWVPNIVLPLLGILVVLFCLLSVVARWGEALRTSRQMFHGYGMDLQISMLSLLIILGVGLSLTGVGISVYNANRDYQAQQKQIVQLENEKRNAEDRAARAGLFVIETSIIPPPTVHLGEIDLARLQCTYELASGISRSEPVTHGSGPRDLNCRITDISHSDVILKLELIDAKTGTVLGHASAPILPLRPKIDLQPE